MSSIRPARGTHIAAASSRALSPDARSSNAPRWGRSRPLMSSEPVARSRRRAPWRRRGTRGLTKPSRAHAPSEAGSRRRTRLFGVAKPLVGDIHLAPLPGAPRYRKEDMAAIIARAVTDAKVYEKGGMNGVIVENHGDIPFLKPADIGPEIIAAMAVIATAVREAVGIPVGVNLLANAAIGSLAIAKASGARFIRVNQWVNAYVSNEGVIEGESAKALRYRKMIDAEDVAIFADVHVKHGAHAIVGDRSVSEQARDVEFYDADVAIATGNRTGDSWPAEG